MTTVVADRTPDALTLAATAAEKVTRWVNVFALEELDVDWSYHPRPVYEGHSPGFYANATPVVMRVPAVRPADHARQEATR